MTTVVENIDFYREIDNCAISNDYNGEFILYIPIILKDNYSGNTSVNLNIYNELTDGIIEITYANIQSYNVDNFSYPYMNNEHVFTTFDNITKNSYYQNDINFDISDIDNQYISYINNPYYESEFKYQIGNIDNITAGHIFPYYDLQTLSSFHYLNLDEGAYDGYIYLYTYTPRTYTSKTIWNQQNNENKLGYLTLLTVPMEISSSYCSLNNSDIWPSSIMKHKYIIPADEEYTILSPSSEPINQTTFTSTINTSKFCIFVKLSGLNIQNDDTYISNFKLSIQGTLTYTNTNTTPTNTSTIPTNFLVNPCNTDGNIILNNSNNENNFIKIIPLPECNNYSTVIKSQVKISSPSGISQGSKIKIATPSIIKYYGNPAGSLFGINSDGETPVYLDNFSYKQIRMTNTLPTLIENYTEDNIFQVVAYDGTMLTDCQDYITFDYQQLNSSIYFQSSSCIENLFDFNFPVPRGFLAMRCYYDEPEYITYTIPQDIPANEQYTFEIFNPVTITGGIVYHVDNPSNYTLNITPSFANITPITELSYNNIYSTIDTQINIIPTFTGTDLTFEVTEGTLPNGLTLNASTGEISGSVQERILTSITITASNILSSMSAIVNIIIKGKLYDVYLMDNIFII